MKVDVLKVDGIEEALLGMGLSYGLTSDKKIRCLKDPKLAARLTKICAKCAQRGNGEDKFLRMIQIWADVTAPRFWWAEFDTYKVGTVALSESTMHTLGKRPLAQEDFEGGLPIELLDWLNTRICDSGYTVEKTMPKFKKGQIVAVTSPEEDDRQWHLRRYESQISRDVHKTFNPDKQDYDTWSLCKPAEEIWPSIFFGTGYTVEVKKRFLPEGFLQRRIVNFSYAVFANMIRQRRNHRLPQWHYFLDNIYYALPMQEFLPPLTAERKKNENERTD